MPHFTVMIGTDGPVIELTVSVGRTWHQFAAHGAPVPSPITVRALIDSRRMATMPANAASRPWRSFLPSACGG